MFECCKTCFFRYIAMYVSYKLSSIKNDNDNNNNFPVVSQIVLHSDSDTDEDL
jgi:hypothetical protein